MSAFATPAGYRTSLWRAGAGLSAGASTAFVLSDSLVWAGAQQAELRARLNGTHILVPPEAQSGIAAYLIALYVAGIALTCAVIWLAVHRLKLASWQMSVVLGLSATVIAMRLSGVPGGDGVLDIGLPLTGAISGLLTWRISYRRKPDEQAAPAEVFG
jgi:hypothetical protein